MKNLTQLNATSLFLVLLSVLLTLAFPHPSNAQEDMAAPSQKAEETPAASEEAVMFYGQTLHPNLIKFSDSDYTWDDLKYLIPKLLPDSQKTQLSANDTCDHIVRMTNLYLIEVDEASNYLAYKLGSAFPDADTDLLLSEKLISRSPKALNELLLSLPDEQSKIITAKDLTLKSLAMILLHDAALANCPNHANEKRYAPITANSTPDADTLKQEEEAPKEE